MTAPPIFPFPRLDSRMTPCREQRSPLRYYHDRADGFPTNPRLPLLRHEILVAPQRLPTKRGATDLPRHRSGLVEKSVDQKHVHEANQERISDPGILDADPQLFGKIEILYLSTQDPQLQIAASHDLHVQECRRSSSESPECSTADPSCSFPSIARWTDQAAFPSLPYDP